MKKHIVEMVGMKDDNIVIGTSLMGSFSEHTKYNQLVLVFGEPNGITDGYKVDAEWIGTINGEVFTIYNYKSGKNYLGEKGLNVEDITDWHIGGNQAKIVDELHEYFLTERTIRNAEKNK